MVERGSLRVELHVPRIDPRPTANVSPVPLWAVICWSLTWRPMDCSDCSHHPQSREQWGSCQGWQDGLPQHILPNHLYAMINIRNESHAERLNHLHTQWYQLLRESSWWSAIEGLLRWLILYGRVGYCFDGFRAKYPASRVICLVKSPQLGDTEAARCLLSARINAGLSNSLLDASGFGAEASTFPNKVRATLLGHDPTSLGVHAVFKGRFKSLSPDRIEGKAAEWVAETCRICLTKRVGARTVCAWRSVPDDWWAVCRMWKPLQPDTDRG